MSATSPEVEARKRECSRKWRAANPERTKEIARRWYQANSERAKAKFRRWNIENRERKLWLGARSRANKRGLAFTITPADIVIPDVCPVLGLPLISAAGQQMPQSATLDRIDNAEGYVPGNICVISWRANRIKGDATSYELRAIAAWMDRVGAP